jgi:hypothetical protein
LSITDYTPKINDFLSFFSCLSPFFRRKTLISRLGGFGEGPLERAPGSGSKKVPKSFQKRLQKDPEKTPKRPRKDPETAPKRP